MAIKTKVIGSESKQHEKTESGASPNPSKADTRENLNTTFGEPKSE